MVFSDLFALVRVMLASSRDLPADGSVLLLSTLYGTLASDGLASEALNSSFDWAGDGLFRTLLMRARDETWPCSLDSLLCWLKKIDENSFNYLASSVRLTLGTIDSASFNPLLIEWQFECLRSNLMGLCKGLKD